MHTSESRKLSIVRTVIRQVRLIHDARGQAQSIPDEALCGELTRVDGPGIHILTANGSRQVIPVNPTCRRADIPVPDILIGCRVGLRR